MLDKQIDLFRIDTNAFLWEDELYWKSLYDETIVSVREKMAEIKKQYGENSEEFKQIRFTNNALKKDMTKWINDLSKAHVDYNKNHKNKRIRQLNRDILYYIDKNDNTEKVRLKKVISSFESTLTRSFGIQTNELTTDIFILEVFYYNVAEDLILYGFDYEGKHYVYFSSSAGQIRTKKAVFVEEEKFKKCQNKLMCGLTRDKINQMGGMNVNKYLAYIALANSATDLWEDVIGKPFDIDRSIVVDDFETLVEGKMDYINSTTYEITPGVVKKEPIPHSDGCGLISSDYCSKNFMVRLPFIKGLLGSFDFKRFIRERNATGKVTDIWGKEYDIFEDQIDIIFTKSQLKMYQFFTSWDEYKENFKKYECEAGICNFEEDKIPNAQINYQMMQTLYDATDEEVKDLCSSANNRIKGITSSLENILWFFHAEDNDLESRIINPSWFEKALTIYPELISDPATKQDLLDCKNSYVKKYRSAKLDVQGKFTFVLPDLYAFCEWLFCDIKEPLGLLENNEVFCRLYSTAEELDCLRSPHLYIEHAIRQNVYNKKYRNQYLKDWFKTDAIYTSTHDLISRILQFDVDGDKLLVLAQKNIIKIAKRVNQNVYPLYYEMGKAKAVQLDNTALYKGLVDAFKGGKIGSISNNITKIWNSGDITEEQKTAIKWLCMETNFNIDYAKTLYKPDRPEFANEIICKYTKRKVPYFFQYAKNKKKEQCEAPVNNIIDNIGRHITDNKYMFSSIKNLQPIDYTMLLRNKVDYGVNKELNKVFDRHNKQYGFNLRADQDDKRKNNINAICTQVMNDLRKIETDEDKIICSIVHLLYEKPSTRKKKLFWMMFGKQVYENIQENVKLLPSHVCKQCGRRTNDILIRNKCFECRQIEVKKLQGKKLIKCIDCGKEILVDVKSRSKRCDECRSKKINNDAANRMKKMRNK